VNKDIQQLIRRLRKQDFDVRFGGSGHYRVTNPDGVTITMPASPNRGNRSMANVRAALRRIGARL
jgi:transcriptional/translational regulatory protein YebC/TACO1